MTDQFHTQRTYIGTTAERGTVGATLGTDGVGFLWRDTTLSSWFWWNGTTWDSMGPGGDPHPQYVIIAPLTDARNVIAAATATIRPLAIQTTDDSLTKNLLEFLASGGGATTVFTAAGNLHIPTTTATVGIIFQNSARFIHTFGLFNVFVGDQSGNFTMTGQQNVGLGEQTLLSLTSGVGNMAIGLQVMRELTTGSANTGVGSFTLRKVTTGNQNFGLGTQALFELLVGSKNVGIGNVALRDCVTAAGIGSNTAIGDQAMFANTTGLGNVGIGAGAGTVNLTGFFNTWVGLIANSVAGQTALSKAMALGYNAQVGASSTCVIGGTGADSVKVAINATTATAQFDIIVNTPARVGQIIELAAAQSADALVIRNSTPATIWQVRHDGGQSIQQAVVATGAPTPSLIVTSAAHTTLTASVERHEVDLNFSATQQWATGPTGTQRTFRVRPQTIAAVGASVFSNVSTIYVDGPPIAGANVTLTNTSALIIASGSTVLGEATKQTNAGSLQLSGYWAFAEDAGDPTADVDYGKMWTKSDNNLYFQDGDGVTHIIHGAPTFLSEAVTTQGLGANPDIFAYGFYEWSAADGNLTQAVSVTLGDANVSHASHAFIVAGGAGATDAGTVGLRVTGTSITDAGVRTVADSETLSADITTLGLDDYLETTLKWLGTVTFELFIVGGLPTVYSLDINYGLAKYEDGMNIDFSISSVQATGLAGAADADFDVQLYHHDPSGTWVYNAAAFTPLNAAQLIASLVTDHSTDDRLANQDHFAWKHTGLSQVISGSTDEGFIILISSSANNAVEYCNLRVGVEF